MTKAIDGIISGSGTPPFYYLCEIWYILEADLPSDGSQTVVIDCSGTPYELEVNGFCAEYTGVEQVAPEATDANNTTSSPISNTISPSDNAWVISTAGSGNTNTVPTQNEGQYQPFDYNGSSSRFCVAELRGASGETSLSTSFSGTINRLERVAASFTEAPAAPPAGPTYQSFTEAKNNSDVTSITVNKPAGTTSGDLLIGVVATDGTAGTFPPPASWTLINSGTNGTAVTVGTWYKIAGGSEPASYTWSWTNPQAVYAFIVRITGHDSSNPINVWGVATGSSTGTSITVTSPDVTTSVADTLVLRIFGADRAMNFGSYPAGHTGITFGSSSGNNTTMYQCTSGAAYKTQAAIGATGTADFTAIPNVFTTEEWRALTVAIAPAAAAPPDISNLPASKDFGTVLENSDYWSSGAEPSWPLTDGDAFFTVTNNGDQCSITFEAINFTGGNGWALTSGSPGSEEVRISVFIEDDGSGDGTALTTSPQELISGLTTDVDWELKLETGTFTDSVQKTSTITLTATLA